MPISRKRVATVARERGTVIKSQLELLHDQAKDLERRYRTELEAMPAGKLAKNRKNGRTYYRIITSKAGKRRSYGVTGNSDLINLYARKEYLCRALRVIEENVLSLHKAAKECQAFDPLEIVGSLSASYQDLELASFFPVVTGAAALGLDDLTAERIASHAAWGGEPYEKSTYREEGFTIVTRRGERMRSKAEAMIADRLADYGIAYHYEEMLYCSNRTFVPDFTFEGKCGTMFYLEFCGRMDDPNYVRKHIDKMHAYEKAGIVPWKNIIYVYASGNELDMRRIEEIIRNQVIPWL